MMSTHLTLKKDPRDRRLKASNLYFNRSLMKQILRNYWRTNHFIVRKSKISKMKSKQRLLLREYLRESINFLAAVVVKNLLTATDAVRSERHTKVALVGAKTSRRKYKNQFVALNSKPMHIPLISTSCRPSKSLNPNGKISWIKRMPITNFQSQRIKNSRENVKLIGTKHRLLLITGRLELSHNQYYQLKML